MKNLKVGVIEVDEIQTPVCKEETNSKGFPENTKNFLRAINTSQYKSWNKQLLTKHTPRHLYYQKLFFFFMFFKNFCINKDKLSQRDELVRKIFPSNKLSINFIHLSLLFETLII